MAETLKVFEDGVYSVTPTEKKLVWAFVEVRKPKINVAETIKQGHLVWDWAA